MPLADHTRTFADGKVFSADDLEAELLVLFAAINGGIDADNFSSSGGTFDFKGLRPTNLGTPSASTDATTKDYVDTLTNNIESNQITAAEREKLADITDTGSGVIISSSERTKLADIDNTRGNLLVGSGDVSKLDMLDTSGSGNLYLDNQGNYTDPNTSALSGLFKWGSANYIAQYSSGTWNVTFSSLAIDTTNGGVLFFMGNAASVASQQHGVQGYSDDQSAFSSSKAPWLFRVYTSDPTYGVEGQSMFLIPFAPGDTYLHLQVDGASTTATLYGYIYHFGMAISY